MDRGVGHDQVESLVFGSDTEELEALQWHFMAQMLMERSILEQKEDSAWGFIRRYCNMTSYSLAR